MPTCRGRGVAARRLTRHFLILCGTGNRQGGESREIFRANSARVAGSCGNSEGGWCGDVQGKGGGGRMLLSGGGLVSRQMEPVRCRTRDPDAAGCGCDGDAWRLDSRRGRCLFTGLLLALVLIPAIVEFLQRMRPLLSEFD
ncbi:MAG: hypothetical protein ACKOEO_20320, partial [Planctomycetaceae bacterium]